MKKIILVLVMGLMIVGCEDTANTASTGSGGSKTISNPTGAKTAEITITTSEAVEYTVTIQPMSNINNPLVHVGTTSAGIGNISIPILEPCIVSVTKNSTAHGASILIIVDGAVYNQSTLNPSGGFSQIFFTSDWLFAKAN